MGFSEWKPVLLIGAVEALQGSSELEKVDPVRTTPPRLLSPYQLLGQQNRLHRFFSSPTSVPTVNVVNQDSSTRCLSLTLLHTIAPYSTPFGAKQQWQRRRADTATESMSS